MLIESFHVSIFNTISKQHVTAANRNSPTEVFLGKGVLKICRKSTGEHPCRSAISIKLQSNFIEITLHHGSSPVKTPFPKNTLGALLLC